MEDDPDGDAWVQYTHFTKLPNLSQTTKRGSMSPLSNMVLPPNGNMFSGSVELTPLPGISGDDFFDKVVCNTQDGGLVQDLD